MASTHRSSIRAVHRWPALTSWPNCGGESHPSPSPQRFGHTTCKELSPPLVLTECILQEGTLRMLRLAGLQDFQPSSASLPMRRRGCRCGRGIRDWEPPTRMWWLRALGDTANRLSSPQLEVTRLVFRRTHPLRCAACNPSACEPKYRSLPPGGCLDLAQSGFGGRRETARSSGHHESNPSNSVSYRSSGTLGVLSTNCSVRQPRRKQHHGLSWASVRPDLSGRSDESNPPNPWKYTVGSTAWCDLL